MIGIAERVFSNRNQQEDDRQAKEMAKILALHEKNMGSQRSRTTVDMRQEAGLRDTGHGSEHLFYEERTLSMRVP